MIYPDVPFTEALFRNPSTTYRGTPFWSWNCRLTDGLIDSQVDMFRQMGMGGAMIHPRTGLDTPYLSGEYIAFVRRARQRLQERGMTCWLYDEERFPSGAAGGIVTRDMRFRSRHILLTRRPRADFCESEQTFWQCVEAGGKPRGYHIGDYQIELRDGRLERYAAVETGNLHAYMEWMDESAWFNDQTYVDVFSREAVERFLEVTYETYKSALGGAFDASVPAIFTDEPHMKGKRCLTFAGSEEDTTLACGGDVPEAFERACGVLLWDVLPELVWELPEERKSVYRLRYHDVLAETFSRAYGDTIGGWCERNGILYTGHFLSERSLYSQTLALGETMRQYRAQQLPGVDILAGQLELTTVKQAQSVRHQMGREGLVCELYGVTNWDFDFKGHKLQGDWLAALGVTCRVHHLAFMSMQGEAKRDWPASIAYQSPWWREYKYIEDHFARVNTVMTRGRRITRVAVVHPIESFWLLFGPNDQTLVTREEMDAQFEQLAQWLCYGAVDYDYLSEGMLPELCPDASAPLKVGSAHYDTVVVPPLLTMRRTTLERLRSFRDAGGKLVFLGHAPALVDGTPSDEPARLAGDAGMCEFTRESVLSVLSDERELSLCDASTGRRADDLFFQLRQENDTRMLFLAHVSRPRFPADRPLRYRISLRGAWRLEELDTLTGEIRPLASERVGSDTVLDWCCFAEDSLLVRMLPDCSVGTSGGVSARRWRTLLSLEQPDAFALDEPNALLLDRFAYALDDGMWRPPEDVLRLDNALRRELAMPERKNDLVQPWLLPRETYTHTARLCARFHSDEAVAGTMLALECPEEASVCLNGENVPFHDAGWFTDESIRRMPLPPLHAGENTLELAYPFGRRTNLEAVYLLGAFGVRLVGDAPALCEAPRMLCFDDLTRQMLPFYTGNVVYRMNFRLARAQSIAVRVPRFAAPVLAVSLDGERRGLIAFDPGRLSLGTLCAGAHTLELTAYGNRFNCFGTLHNANPNYMWYGPDSYRTVGSEWTSRYLVRPTGILDSVLLETEE